MPWLLAIIAMGLLWTRCEDDRRLRELRGLMRELDSQTPLQPFAPLSRSPTPNQLLGDIARPLAPFSRDKYGGVR